MIKSDVVIAMAFITILLTGCAPKDDSLICNGTMSYRDNRLPKEEIKSWSLTINSPSRLNFLGGEFIFEFGQPMIKRIRCDNGLESQTIVCSNFWNPSMGGTIVFDAVSGNAILDSDDKIFDLVCKAATPLI